MDKQDAIDLVQSVLYLEARMGYRPDLKEAWDTVLKLLGVTTIVSEDYTLTHRGERILWVLLEDDAQGMANMMLGRKLTEDELYRVKKGLENGMRYDVELKTAIEMATET